MFRRVFLFIASGALIVEAAPPEQSPSVAGVAEFDAAYRAWDGERFAAAAEMLRQSTAKPSATATDFYWLGVALFHCMLYEQHTEGKAPDDPAVTSTREAAIEALSAGLERDPLHAEMHALLGTLYGMKISGSMLRALRFGPKVSEHRKKALANGADNPRVQYLLGTCQWHAAKSADGRREALASLLAAERLFQAEALSPASPGDPRWGHDTCLVFIGRAYESLGQREEAAIYFRKVLARQPNHGLAKEGLARVTTAH